MCDFEIVPHTADIQIRVYGKTLQELFRHALIGMFQSIEPRSKSCSVVEGRVVSTNLDKHHAVQVESPDIDALLVDFLSEALYLSDVHNEAYLDATVSVLNQHSIQAVIYGVSVEGFGVEVKAVTYHNLSIQQNENGLWQTDIVFDI